MHPLNSTRTSVTCAAQSNALIAAALHRRTSPNSAVAMTWPQSHVVYFALEESDCAANGVRDHDGSATATLGTHTKRTLRALLHALDEWDRASEKRELALRIPGQHRTLQPSRLRIVWLTRGCVAPRSSLGVALYAVFKRAISMRDADLPMVIQVGADVDNDDATGTPLSSVWTSLCGLQWAHVARVDAEHTADALAAAVNPTHDDSHGTAIVRPSQRRPTKTRRFLSRKHVVPVTDLRLHPAVAAHLLETEAHAVNGDLQSSTAAVESRSVHVQLAVATPNFDGAPSYYSSAVSVVDIALASTRSLLRRDTRANAETAAAPPTIHCPFSIANDLFGGGTALAMLSARAIPDRCRSIVKTTAHVRYCHSSDDVQNAVRSAVTDLCGSQVGCDPTWTRMHHATTQAHARSVSQMQMLEDAVHTAPSQSETIACIAADEMTRSHVLKHERDPQSPLDTSFAVGTSCMVHQESASAATETIKADTSAARVPPRVKPMSNLALAKRMRAEQRQREQQEDASEAVATGSRTRR